MLIWIRKENYLEHWKAYFPCGSLFKHIYIDHETIRGFKNAYPCKQFFTLCTVFYIHKTNIRLY